MSNSKKQNESFSDQKDRKKAGIENERDYQKHIEGTTKSVSLKQKYSVLSTSFKMYFVIYLTTILWIPLTAVVGLLVSSALVASTSVDLTVYYGWIENYTYFINFGWLTDLIIVSATPHENIVFLISHETGITNLPSLLFLYIIFQSIVSFVMLMIPVFFLKKDQEKTLGEQFQKKLEKYYKTGSQTQLSEGELQRNAGSLGPALKDFRNKILNIIEKDKKNGAQYYYLSAITAYKSFFGHQDSRSANAIATPYNERWKEMSRKKREVETDGKLFNLIEAGYVSLGETKDGEEKNDILTNIPYFFIGEDENGKKYQFNEKRDIFKKSKTPFLLKRNLLVLMATTTIFKNLPLAPIYKYLKTKYGIIYNGEERLFIKKFRRIYEIYENGTDKFTSEETYLLPLHLQYLRIINDEDGKDREEKVNAIVRYTKLPLKLYGIFSASTELRPDDPEAQEAFTLPYFEGFKSFEEKVIKIVTREILYLISIEGSLKEEIKGYKSRQKIEDLDVEHAREIIKREVFGSYIQYKSPEGDTSKEEYILDKGGNPTKIRKIPMWETDTGEWKLEDFNLSALNSIKKYLASISLPEMKRISTLVVKEVYNIHHEDPFRSPLSEILIKYGLYNSLGSLKKRLLKN